MTTLLVMKACQHSSSSYFRFENSRIVLILYFKFSVLQLMYHTYGQNLLVLSFD